MGKRANFATTLKSVSRSVIPKAIGVGIFASATAIVFHVLANEGVLSFAMDGKNYAVYSSCLAFLLVFRNGKAYSRWWDGVQAMTQLKTDWLDACAQLVASTLMSDAPTEKVTAYIHVMARLFSILSCISFKHIADMHDERFEVLNVDGLDSATKDLLWKSPERPRHILPIVEQWIMNHVHRGMSEGIVVAPAPIVNRFFTGLHSGCVLVKKCQIISFTAFPTPYSIMVNSLLVLHIFYTAAFASVSQEDPFYMSFAVFCNVFAFWAINLIAIEIEHPFGDDVNDINLHLEQKEINHHLLLLLDPRARHKPDCDSYALMTGPDFRVCHLSNEIMRDEGGSLLESQADVKVAQAPDSATKCIDVVISPDANSREPELENIVGAYASNMPLVVPSVASQQGSLPVEGVVAVRLADEGLFRELAVQQQLTTSILEQLKEQAQRRELLIHIQERHNQLLNDIAESCSKFFKDSMGVGSNGDLRYGANSRDGKGLVEINPCSPWSAFGTGGNVGASVMVPKRGSQITRQSASREGRP